MQTFYGTGVALVTPFNDDQSIDWNAYKNLIEYCISNSVDYITVNGTTAESATTSLEEKNELLRVAIEVNNNRVPVMFGIGGNHTKEILERIRTTNFNGVDAVLSVCPYYNKPSQEGIFQHYKAIADESPVPVLTYNVPGRTGINISAKTSIRLSEIPNILGVKEAGGDLTQMLDIIKNTRDEFLLIVGDDMLAVPAISIGAVGTISVLANPFPKAFSDMIRSALQSRFQHATEVLKSLSEINTLMYEEGNPVGVKTLLRHMQLMNDQVRLPLVPSSDSLESKIKIAYAAYLKNKVVA
ncbi:MAG: 4-hydroxy-tetrahydrodipicolinate synthase [Cytophagaceae bacterium]|jgi:4-hydroxy-tetrahydrodipicolinate synthase|nr:4-hydroxy-tetrahydrodipicolinate synthase [Cytophagaceae bacterium]